MTRLFRRATQGGARRDMSLWPFASTSPWAIPIGSGATFQNATTQPTADLLNTASAPDIAINQWTHPIYYATASDPLVSVNWVDGGQIFQYRIPATAVPSPPDINTTTNTDSHLHVVQPDGRTLAEAWYFKWTSSTTATAGYVAINPLDGDGLTDGVRGYGGSAIGGLIRKHEFANRYIPHALAVALESAYMKPNGFVWPAIREDSSAAATYLGNVGMGTFAAIPPTVNLAGLGLSTDGLVLATALQDYGMYVSDSAGNFTFYAEIGSDIVRAEAMYNDLPTIRAQLRVVTNNTSSNVGGGGTRRRPLAPRLITAAAANAGGGGGGGTVTNAAVREVVTNAGYTGVGSSTTVTTGSGTQVGDMLVAFCGTAWASTSETLTTVPAAPTGTAGTWTNRGPVNRQNSRPHLQMWTRPVTTAGAQTVNWGLSPVTTDCAALLEVYVVSGSSLSVVAGSVSIGQAAAGSTAWPAPSVACAANDLLLCAWQPFAGTSTPPTIPGSMSNAATTPVVDQSVQRSAREVIASGTTTGTRTATAPGTALAYAAGSVTVRAA